jgi:ElaB/YqjD/DUF883 family membrane-anchored ribosome-binding protein
MLYPGLLGGLLFFAVVLVGCSYIVVSKIGEFPAILVTAVPVLIMLVYAVLLGVARLFRLRDDQSGDNLYYMGFLFTLTSLAVSLYQFSAAGSSEQIVQNFGIAIASTIAGIALRILFNQMRRDPVEVEATARLELADASRRVKRELDSSVLEFGYFRRMSQQSMMDALAELEQLFASTKEHLAIQMADLARSTSKPLEDASRASGETMARLTDRTAETIESASKQLAEEANRLSRSTQSIVAEVDDFVSKLAAVRVPDNIIEVKLQPMIQDLSRAVAAFDGAVARQAEAASLNLAETRKMTAAIVSLAAEIRSASERTAPREPPAPQRDAAAPGEPSRDDGVT